jgi:hypothetical protein
VARALRGLAVAIALAAVACGGKPTRVGETPLAGVAPTWKFDSLDERPVSSDAFKGKPSVIAFISTGDPYASQAEVNFLVAMAKNDGERVNYALVALQDGTTRELVEIYRDTLKVTFPVALGDSATTAGGGPFGDVGIVPTVVVLDAEGRIALKKSGVVKPEEIRAELNKTKPAE